MQEISFGHSSIEWAGAGLGVLLIFFGRKLYWLALGGIGLALGLFFARQVFHLDSRGEELLIALLLGLVGAVLAVQAQKIAIAIGGFLLGGGAVLWLAERLGWAQDMKLVLFVFIGAVLGYLLAQGLFELALVLITAAVGAALVVNASHLGIREQPWLFFPLVAVGALWQGSGRRRR